MFIHVRRRSCLRDPSSTLAVMERTCSVTIAFSPTEASPTQLQAYFSMKLCSSGTGCAPLVSLRGTGVATGMGHRPFQPSIGASCPLGRTGAQVLHGDQRGERADPPDGRPGGAEH